MKAIAARNLSKTYWYYEKEAGLSSSLRALFRGRKVSVEAVRGVNLDVGVGEMVGFIGPNGAGKTTTLKMMAGILHPTRGDVEVVGYLPHRREKPFLRKISFMSGQRSRLFWDLPAEEYFRFCQVVYEIPHNLYERNMSDLVEMAGIEDILQVPQRKLSFGQRKRCEMVAALLHDPEVIFLDEPTNAMDLVNARKVREFIRERGKERKHTTVLTSHNMSDIEQVCERIVIINRGRIVFDGTVRDLKLRDGLQKQIRVVFDQPFPMHEIEKLGKISSLNGQEVLLEVEPEKAASVSADLCAAYSVKDISIMDPPLEKVIESIYVNG